MLLDALAHEFQTPLTSIRAGVHAMLADSPGRDQREWLEIMNEESDRLSAMMAETIQMARLQAGKSIWTSRRTPWRTWCIRRSKRKSRRAIKSVELPVELPAISADAGLIRMVIRQLAGNALKYSQPGAPITVRAHAG